MQEFLSRLYDEKIKPLLETIGTYNLCVTYIQIIHNEIRTPTIPEVSVLMKDGGQQKGHQDDYKVEELDEPPQPPPNPKDPDPKKEAARGVALGEIFRKIKNKLKSMRSGSLLKQYQKKGNFDTAKKDFDSLQLNNVKNITDHKGIKYVGDMPNGQHVVVRNHSSNRLNSSTLEFQEIPNGDQTIIKIRYME